MVKPFFKQASKQMVLNCKTIFQRASKQAKRKFAKTRPYVLARLLVTRTRAWNLTKYGDGDTRSIPPYSSEKGDADKGPSTGTVEHRFPCSLGYSKQK